MSGLRRSRPTPAARKAVGLAFAEILRSRWPEADWTLEWPKRKPAPARGEVGGGFASPEGESPILDDDSLAGEEDDGVETG